MELRLLSSQQLLWDEERQLLFQTPSSVGTRCCRVQRWTVGVAAQLRTRAECHRNAPLKTDTSPPGTASRTQSTEERQEPPGRLRLCTPRVRVTRRVNGDGRRAPRRARGRCPPGTSDIAYGASGISRWKEQSQAKEMQPNTRRLCLRTRQG